MRIPAACVALSCLAAQADADGPIRTLLLTGQQNHNWRYTSRYHAETLAASGRFAVDVADNAPAALANADTLKSYPLIVLDYNGERWGEPAETNFLNAVRAGAGVVIIHASNNPFPGWAEYEKLCALLWRDGTGHGTFHAFDVRYTEKEHPVTKGLADMTAHPDELYHRLVNVQNVEFKTLAVANSTADSGGSGQDEPMAITLTYGSGRIFHTPLGHVWEGAQGQKASIADPQFKILLLRGAEWAATGNVTFGSTVPPDARPHNALTAEEKAAGWTLLFDGQTPVGLRGFKQDAFPSQGWAIENGTIRKVAGAGGGDLVTREQYDDFELSVDWLAAPAANSGIMYNVTEDHTYPWETGPEMQILDNAGHADGKNPMTSAGSLYALYVCRHDVARPAGEWNTARIVIKGNRVEHWLNGWLIVESEIGGEEWTRLVAASKFNAMPDYGKRASGHLAFQDHGDDVWFRNMKIRRLN